MQAAVGYLRVSTQEQGRISRPEQHREIRSDIVVPNRCVGSSPY